jgi:hypothetical protein
LPLLIEPHFRHWCKNVNWLSRQIASAHSCAKTTPSHGMSCLAGTVAGSRTDSGHSTCNVAVLTTASSRCLSRLGRKLAMGHPATSLILSACQKPFHGKSWRQMPLMLFRKIAMALPSHSTRFTTLLQEKRSISLPTSYPYCATEQLHGPAQLSLKGCIPLVTAFFHRGASLDRMVSSWISSLHSRAVQEFSLAI